MGKYFGTDGIRGEANLTLTASLAFKLGCAMKHLNVDKVIIGCDTRESKDILSQAVCAGVLSQGMDVILAGVIPTPCLIYYSEVNKIAGVMITASHNPYTDNGLKVFMNGRKLNEEQEGLLEKEIDDEIALISDKKIKVGHIVEALDVERLYLDMLKSNAPKSSKLKIALDCANGATYVTAPKVFRAVTNYLYVTGNKPDGVNINTNCGSTHIDNLLTFTLESKCDVGFAFDGDGDRCIASDGNRVYDGDMLIYIIGEYFKKHGMLNKNHIVFTIMSNLGILNGLKKKGIDLSLTNVGDKYVVNELVNNNYSLGGEASGHIIMPDLLKTGDGTLVALTVIKIMEETGKSLHQLTGEVTLYPDKTTNVKVVDKALVMNNSKLIDQIEEIKTLLGNDGKVILRPSGTENLIRITVSAKTYEEVENYTNQLLESVNQSLS